MALRQGDFDWMMLGYAEDKKNTLRLLETGNGGREAIVDFVKDDMGGALDKVMYLIIKEDYSCNKCTFVCWIGAKVPAFVKANTSTHRGAISEWVSTVIHNLREEYVHSGNDLLGLKDEDEGDGDTSRNGGGADDSMTANVVEIDKSLHAKPYAGKVLEEVKRDKTPHELWLERKQARESGTAVVTPDKKGASATGAGNVHQFTQVVLKKNDTSKSKGLGRSKWSQKKDLASDGGSSEHGSEASSESALSAAKTGVNLAEQARLAAEEAAALEKEAARRRELARELEERARQEDEENAKDTRPRSGLEDVMGEEPDWSPDDMSEPEGEGAQVDDADADADGYKELGGDATVKHEVERSRSAAAVKDEEAEGASEGGAARSQGKPTSPYRAPPPPQPADLAQTMKEDEAMSAAEKQRAEAAHKAEKAVEREEQATLEREQEEARQNEEAARLRTLKEQEAREIQR